VTQLTIVYQTTTVTMLTRAEVNVLNHLAYLTTFSFPFDWDPKTRKLFKASGKFKRLGVLLNALFSLIYLSFLLIRFIPDLGYNYKESSIQEIAPSLFFHILFTVIQIVTLVLLLSGFAYGEEITHWYNLMMKFNRETGGY